jgi:leader peptidase (prepilin peptidase) / N-methyltransferase
MNLPRTRERERPGLRSGNGLCGKPLDRKGDARFPAPVETDRPRPLLFGSSARTTGRIASSPGESSVVDLGAGFVGLLLGLAAGPAADLLATTAPVEGRLFRRAPRSSRFALVSAMTAILGAACGLVFGFTLEAVIAGLFCFVLVVVTWTDLEHRLIPDRVVLPAAIVVLALRTLDEPSLAWLLGGLGAGLALFLLVLAYPKGMGMGDVKLALFMGTGLGAGVIVALFVGFLAGALPAVWLLVRHGRAARKLAIPLGPFLALGGVVALFAGDAILRWYWN